MRAYPVRRLAVIAVVSVTAVTSLVACSSGGSSSSSSSGGSSSASSPAPQPSPTSTVTAGTSTVTVGLNEPARLGPLAYNVTKVEDIGNKLETPEGGSLSTGTFIAASVTAHNDGTAPFRLSPELFTISTSSGQSLRANLSDSIVANGNDPSFNQPISKGASVTGVVVFNFTAKPKGDITQITITDPSGGKVIVTVK